ncbi:DEAD/DEAH box helicase family protein [Candidatus Nomurabacteria bacterium]|uniref:DEAD/DEAH box helicase family protein n=1 Tax=Candidatus Dojkabacteria bacterium TaxID=2099670 RepID=A0A955RIG7_9BACT|nr:DEAD/DEAH box helicase family protein [Candidatus Dojkabacteria bacterium]MCB9806281.1 DEAD/DEAH box helicase family protein [Candidatus Nomurabacteria bacterium]
MAKKVTKLSENLVLNRYILSLFEEDNLDGLSQYLKDSRLETYDENNQSRFLNTLLERYNNLDQDFSQALRKYDHNIYLHTKQINQKRTKPITWKYFQYLGLLFTEIILDKYFSNKDQLILDLNEFAQKLYRHEEVDYEVSPFTLSEFNKLVFWQATGSGKTLTLHINYLQLKHYLDHYKLERNFNKFILLTPNEGLSKQHLEELRESNIGGEIFDKSNQGGLFSSSKDYIEIIDIHKLKDKSGDKTVAVDSFGQNNIVFVDEGHRGSSGEEWLKMRDRLTLDGFSFEYSATFEQAISPKEKKLFNLYSKTILFDYSYKYFYLDGYGKEYRILNISNNNWSETRFRYLVSSLLSYYQQLKLFESKKQEFKPFNIEKPLMIFVGGSVNAVRTENKEKVSDVIDILLFLKSFLEDKQTSIKAIDSILKEESGLLDDSGTDVFSGQFRFLQKLNLGSNDLYKDLLIKIFNTSNSTASFQLINLKSVDGEIGVRLGSSAPYFAVINVGDDRRLLKLCEENNLQTNEQEFANSLFNNINSDQSSINLLIGSKKFTEGWNSWRVSCIGLMNLGRTEGSEIIQLFGRGVRLKGYNWSLKRSESLKKSELSTEKPDYLSVLETLNIFGVRADYMYEFKEYLEREGIPTKDNIVEITLPTIKNFGSLKHLKVISSKAPEFIEPIAVDEPIKPKRKVELNLYAKLTSISSLDPTSENVSKHEISIDERLVDFFDFNKIFFEVNDYCKSQGWTNITVSKQTLKQLLLKDGWYQILAPQNLFNLSSFSEIDSIQSEVVIPLLKKYIKTIYTYFQSEHESKYRTYTSLSDADPNIVGEYLITIDKSEEALIEDLQKYSQEIKRLNDDYDRFDNKLKLINFSRHIYQPLVFSDHKSKLIKVSPVALNESEKDFVEEIRVFYRDNQSMFESTDLYLLRNQSKGNGISFFEANNFFPDFIMWLVEGDKQKIIFIDPKGIREVGGMSDPKIQFSHAIKQIEDELGDKNVSLNSFIITPTYLDQSWWGNDYSEEDFQENNVLFMRDGYLSEMFNKL